MSQGKGAAAAARGRREVARRRFPQEAAVADQVFDEAARQRRTGHGLLPPIILGPLVVAAWQVAPGTLAAAGNTNPTQGEVEEMAAFLVSQWTQRAVSVEREEVAAWRTTQG